jgi:hypothetical protein
MKFSDVTQIVARAVAEPAYRAALTQNPKDALKRMGVDLPAMVNVHVFQNDPKTFHAVLPMKGDAQMQEILRKANPVAFKVYEKAWQDPAYKKRLFSEPRQAFMDVTGVTPPPGLTLVAHEDTPNTLNIVLPYMGKAGELSDVDLEHVSGGKGSVSRCNDAMGDVVGGGTEATIDAGVASGGIGAAVGVVATGVAAGFTALVSWLK